MFTFRALREAAVPFAVLLALLVVLLGLSHAGAVWSRAVAAALLLLLAATVLFFRDPSRRPPIVPGAILAPADGRVVAISTLGATEFLPQGARRVAIFLSIFDVHVQRAPIRGRIALVQYRPGAHVDARRREAAERNECRLIGLEAEDGFRISVRQIAGRVARRIVGWADEGAWLAQGERLGMIRFGSCVELSLPEEAEILVRLGDHVKGGETIVARRP